MATTAIQIEKDGKVERVYFMTVQKENGEVDVDIYKANEEWIPEGKPSIGYAPMGEEEYHKQLRQLATERGQFVPSYSTNLEWNPGYNPDDYDFDKLKNDINLNDAF